MQSLSKYNKGTKYLLCAIDLFSKNLFWVVPLKDKRGISIVNAFQKIISEGRKANKILLLKDLLGCWKARFFKHMKAVSKNVYFDVFDDIVNKYNNTVHRTIKMKPIDVTSDSYAEYNEDSNVTKPRCKVGDHVRISKYRNIFAKGYIRNWSEKVFVVSKIKNTFLWTYVICDLNGEPIAGSFYENQLQKTSEEWFRVEKIIKRKGDKMYAKWKGYNNSFNSWIDKERPHIKMS